MEYTISILETAKGNLELVREYSEGDEKELIKGRLKELHGVISTLSYAAYNTRERKIDIKDIQETVSDYFNISVDRLLSRTREIPIVQPRQLSMFLTRKYTLLTYDEIGEQTGNKDHATVLHACRVIRDIVYTDKAFSGHVYEITKRIKDLKQ